MNINRAIAILASVTMSVCTWAPAGAVPYASNVRNTSGNTWGFVLNQAADNVTVLRNGGNALNLGALAAGRHTFDMTGFSNFDIRVTESATEGWARISNTANMLTHFEQPTGLAVNTDPSTAFFGTIYVNNSRTNGTVTGRAMGDGVYALTADMVGVDLANNFAVVTNAQDTTQAKAPGWTPDASNTSPWRMTLDAGGNLILGDWSDNKGGIKYANRSLTAGGLVLNEENGPAGGVFSTVSDEFGLIPLHGSIASRPYTTGTVLSDLTVWGMDEDLDADLEHPGNDGNSVWRWNVGDDTNHTINPTLVIDVGAIPPTSDARSNFLPSQAGIPADAHYEPRFDKWYLTQRGQGDANTGDAANLVVVTADGVNGLSPTLDWSSLQFSITNNLDGNNTVGGIQDIFRHAGSVEISPDGTKMFVHKARMRDAAGVDSNLVLGPTSNAPGVILVVPLDENGVPDLTVSGGVVTNIDSISVTGNDLFKTNYELTFDAAGNMYITHSDSELLEVYSPGGDTIAKTSWLGGSNFDFELVPPGLTGDHNGDGKVDAADYVTWRKNPAGFGNAQGYTDWRANFGAVAGAGGGGVGAVPEPGSMVLVIVGLGLVGGRRWRGR